MRWGLAILATVCGCGRFGFSSHPAGDARDDGAATTDVSTIDTTGTLDAAPDASLASMAFAYWKVDDATGTSAADASGNGHTMTLFNGAAWGAGMFGGALTSDGIDDYASVPLLDLSGTAAVTVSIWVNRTYTNGPNHTLIELTTNTNSFTTGFGMFPDDAATCGAPGRILMFVRGDVGYAAHCYAQPSSGVWHHLVGIYDKSQPAMSEIALYIDDVKQTPISAPFLQDNTNNFGAEPLYLFARGGTAEFNPGTVDELAIFDRALTAAELAML